MRSEGPSVKGKGESGKSTARVPGVGEQGAAFSLSLPCPWVDGVSGEQAAQERHGLRLPQS